MSAHFPLARDALPNTNSAREDAAGRKIIAGQARHLQIARLAVGCRSCVVAQAIKRSNRRPSAPNERSKRGLWYVARQRGVRFRRSWWRWKAERTLYQNHIPSRLIHVLWGHDFVSDVVRLCRVYFHPRLIFQPHIINSMNITSPDHTCKI